jgi:hypothetical protein
MRVTFARYGMPHADSRKLATYLPHWMLLAPDPECRPTPARSPARRAALAVHDLERV